MLIATMAIHEALAQKQFEFNLRRKKIAFPNTSNYGLECDESLISSHLI